MFKNMYKKVRKTSQKFKAHKNYRQNWKNKVFSKKKKGILVEQYAAGHLCTKFEGFILIYEAMIVKYEFDLLLSVK